jgi:hypothetical protein
LRAEGPFGGVGINDLDSRAGTEILYVIALQKYPPWMIKGVVGSVAIWVGDDGVRFGVRGERGGHVFRLVKTNKGMGNLAVFA